MSRYDELAFEPEGPADSQRGEPITLASAKDEIDAAPDVAEVNRLFNALGQGLGEEDQDALRLHASERCEALLRERA